MTKKISYADAKYIFNYKKSHPIERLVCNITMADGWMFLADKQS